MSDAEKQKRLEETVQALRSVLKEEDLVCLVQHHYGLLVPKRNLIQLVQENNSFTMEDLNRKIERMRNVAAKRFGAVRERFQAITDALQSQVVLGVDLRLAFSTNEGLIDLFDRFIGFSDPPAKSMQKIIQDVGSPTKYVMLKEITRAEAIVRSDPAHAPAFMLVIAEMRQQISKL